MKEVFGIPANLKRTRSLFVLFPCCMRQVNAVNAILQKATGFLFSIFFYFYHLEKFTISAVELLSRQKRVFDFKQSAGGCPYGKSYKKTSLLISYNTETNQ